MSIAELRGKLSPESANDRMEDLLTSDVFGTMYYAGWEFGFRDWLLEAQPAEGTTRMMQVFLGSSSIRKILFRFWPTLPNGREPDLALLFASEDGSCRVLIIEAKYLSGQSDFEVNDGEVANSGRTGNQLIDEMMGFAEADGQLLMERWFEDYGRPIPNRMDFAHLLVTKDWLLPRNVYSEAMRRLDKLGLRSFPCPAYWLSWRSLPKKLEPFSRPTDSVSSRLLSDLISLLEQKELTDKQFEAFHSLEWAGSMPSTGFWHRKPYFNFHGHDVPGRLSLGTAIKHVFWRESL